MKKTAIIMGSDSDLKVVEKAIEVFESFEAPFEVHIFSAHRTPAQLQAFVKSAEENDFGVIIAAAGMAAHLAGAVAAATTLPVIGIPIKSASFDGMDALLSTVMMPPGIPVATVGVDGAKNAALLALEILALGDEALSRQLKQNRQAAANTVLEKNKATEEKYNH
ncbi:MAG: 5-(carboxyamino)imidazole ribonucleotide mutase [Clostridia bacterium]|nr:5-(carboxyamino)imidazole ribonucleotide mutase [Clostridia bacterium]